MSNSRNLLIYSVHIGQVLFRGLREGDERGERMW